MGMLTIWLLYGINKADSVISGQNQTSCFWSLCEAKLSFIHRQTQKMYQSSHLTLDKTEI